MRIVKTATCIFYTPDKRILLQDRRSISKWGEEWSYFGGKLEEGETPEEALVREIEEELSYTLTEYVKIGIVKVIIERLDVDGTMHIFSSPLPSVDFDQKEGDGRALYTIEEARNLKMNKDIDYLVLDKIEEYFKSIN